MKKIKLLLFVLLFLITIFVSTANEVVLNFGLGGNQKFYQDYISIQKSFDILKNNNKTNIIYDFNDNDIYSYSCYFLRNTNYITDSGRCGFSNSTNETGFTNNSWILFDRLGSLDTGSQAVFFMHDIVLNDTYLINNTNISYGIKKYDYNIGSGNSFIIFLLDNNNVFNFTFQLGTSDFENLSISKKVSDIFSFNRIIVKNPISTTGFTFSLWLNNITFENISVYNVSEENITNFLPEFNVTFAKDTYCLDSNLNEVSVNYTINVFDKENDNIYYSLKADFENIFTTVSFDSTLDGFSLKGGFCSVSNFLPFLNTIPTLSLLSSLCFGSVSSTFDTYTSNFKTFGSSCSVVENKDNKTEFFYDSFLNPKTNKFRIGLFHNNKCLKDTESFFVLNENYKDFIYSTELFYYDFLTNSSFNLTFYENPLDNTNNFELGTKLKLRFDIINSTFVKVSNQQVNIFLGKPEIRTNILNVSIPYNQKGIYNYLGIDLNYDYETDKYNLSVTNFEDKNFNVSGISAYWFNITTASNPLIKVIGLESNKKDYSTIIQLGFGYGGFELNPNWINVLPNNITFDGIGTKSINFYVTDEFHLPLNEFVYKEKVIDIIEKDVCIDIDVFVDENKININPETNSEHFNNFIIAIRQFYLILRDVGILESALFGIKFAVLYMMWNQYKHQTQVLNKESKDVLRTIFQYMFFIVSFLYLAFLIEKSWFVVFSILGILYFSYEFLNITGSLSTNAELNIVYSLLMFSVLNFVWFGLFQIASGVNFGFPVFPQLSLTNIFPSLLYLGKYIIDLLLFSIPNIPLLLNILLVLFKVLGVLSGIIYLYEKLNPLK